MLTFWGIVTGLTIFGAAPTVGGLWLFERWRARRRNRGGQCAACGVEWKTIAHGEPYLIQGRLVCEECADKARRRMPWHFGILAAAVATGSGIALIGAEASVMVLLPVGSSVAMTVVAVQLMKFANRRAQRRIAAGEFPDIQAVRSSTAPPDDAGALPGPAV